VKNKGLYSPNYSDTSRAEQFSLNKKSPGSALASTTQSTPNTPPAADAQRVPGSAAPASSATASTTPGTPPVDPSKPAAAATAQSYGTFTLADLKAQVPQSKEGNFILEVPEIFYTAGDKEVQGVLAGQPIETVAQVMPEKVNNESGKRLRIFRLLVQCCAADARPFSVPVEFAEKAPEIADMTWVKVVGKLAYRQEGGQTIPLLLADKAEETTAPDQSMLY
jgi:hypothetical protein